MDDYKLPRIPDTDNIDILVENYIQNNYGLRDEVLREIKTQDRTILKHLKKSVGFRHKDPEGMQKILVDGAGLVYKLITDASSNVKIPDITTQNWNQFRNEFNQVYGAEPSRFLRETSQKLKVYNPILLNHISHFAETYGNTDPRIFSTLGSAIMHKILEYAADNEPSGYLPPAPERESVPENNSVIEELEAKMNAAVEREEYREAAKYRDMIKEEKGIPRD